MKIDRSLFKNGKLLGLAFFLFSLITILVFTKFSQYRVAGDNLIPEGNTNSQALRYSSLDSIQYHPKSNVLSLVSSSFSEPVSYSHRIQVPGGCSHVRLSAEICFKHYVSNPDRKGFGRLLLLGYDKFGKPALKKNHKAAKISKEEKWTQIQHEFWVNPENRQKKIIAEIRHAKGTFLLKNLRLEPLQQDPTFAIKRKALLGMWILLICWFLIFQVQGRKVSLPLACYFLTGTIIVIGVLTPVDGLEKIKEKLSSFLKWGGQEVHAAPGKKLPNKSSSASKRKIVFSNSTPWFLSNSWGHFLFFAALTFCLILIKGKSQAFQLFGYLLLFAFVTEVLQFFVEGRNPKIEDFLIDAGGILLAFLITPKNGRDFEVKDTEKKGREKKEPKIDL